MKNTFIINVENRGIGDFLFSVLLAIFLKEKFEKIYIYYGAIHFNGMIYLMNKLFNENNADNIVCIGDSKWKPKDYLLSNQFIYLDDPNLSEEIIYYLKKMHAKLEIDSNNNCFFSFSAVNKVLLHNLYYQHFLNFFGIKHMKELKESINFTLNENELSVNEQLYEKLLKKIDNQKYILVFHCIERDQYNFGFRDYPNDINKNNYKIIYLCDNKFGKNLTNYDKNICYINELLGKMYPMYMYHKIIENAEEIHLIDSYPFHYLFLLKNIEHKTIMYPRALTGYKKTTYFPLYKYNIKLSNDYISAFNKEMFFYMYESYCPINYFKCINSDTFKYIKVYDEILSDRKNFKKSMEELSKYKVLPMIGIGNGTGILLETILSNINFIEVSLKNVDDLENIYNYIDNSMKTINSDNLFTSKESLNILLIKTEGDYFIKIKPYKKEITEGDIYLESNIDNIEKNLIDTIDKYMENTDIHYIYPYRNEKDKEQFIEKIQIKSSEMFDNKVDFKKYNILTK